MHMTAKLYKLAGVFNNTSGLCKSSTAQGHCFFFFVFFLLCFVSFFFGAMYFRRKKQNYFSARTVKYSKCVHG